MALTKTPVCDFGKKAEDFKLKSINNKVTTLKDIKGEKATLIMFICNHCPYVKAIIKDLARDCNELRNYGISAVAIMSNDTKNYPEDSFDNMIKFAKKNNFGNMNYLFDETQEIAKAYKAECTPEFYLFNEQKRLVYRGRFDETSPGSNQAPHGSDLRNAIACMINNQKISTNQFPSMGCNIKWK